MAKLGEKGALDLPLLPVVAAEQEEALARADG